MIENNILRTELFVRLKKEDDKLLKLSNEHGSECNFKNLSTSELVELLHAFETLYKLMKKAAKKRRTK